MKRFILGFLLGILALVAFIFYGGGDYLKHAGSRTEDAGQVLKRVEKKMKKSVSKAKETAESTVDKTREKVGDTADKVKELVP